MSDEAALRARLALLLREGALPAAREAAGSLVTLAPHDRAARVAYTHILDQLGLPSAAAACWDSWLTAHPDDLHALLARALLALDLDDRPGARAALTRAAALPLARAALARLDALDGDHACASAQLAAALAADPADHRIWSASAEIALIAGDPPSAVAALKRAASLAPPDLYTLELLAALLAASQAAEALQLADAWLMRAPHHSGALAMRRVAHVHLGLATPGAPLDALVQQVALGDQDALAFGSLSAFLDALERHVLDAPSLRWAPARHATIAGHHSGDLLAAGGPVSDALHALLMRGASRALKRMPAEVAAARPAALGLHTWGVALRGEGHQRAHIHPEA